MINLRALRGQHIYQDFKSKNRFYDLDLFYKDFRISYKFLSEL